MRGEPFHPFTVLRFTLAYTSYLVSKCVFVVCALPVLLVLLPFPRFKYRLLLALIHRFLGFFTRRWLPLLGIYRLAEIAGLDRALTTRPAVLVANHRSFMDSILVLGLVPRLGVVIKSRDTRQMTYALLTRHFDLVSVNRHALSSVGESLDKCRRLLAEGKSLLVFPEGNRARSGRLMRFDPLAFQIAVEAKVPVIPVILHSTQPFMARVPGSVFPRHANTFRIRFLEPFSPNAGEHPDRLADRVHRRMAGELATLDAGTSWQVQPTPQSAPV